MLYIMEFHRIQVTICIYLSMMLIEHYVRIEGSWQFDPYVSFCASTLVEILAYLLIHATLNRVGRKIPYCSFAIAFGIAAMLVLPVQTFMTGNQSGVFVTIEK